jgi:hypothetical protein
MSDEAAAIGRVVQAMVRTRSSVGMRLHLTDDHIEGVAYTAIHELLTDLIRELDPLVCPACGGNGQTMDYMGILVILCPACGGTGKGPGR